jgi:hypothetical protein
MARKAKKLTALASRLAKLTMARTKLDVRENAILECFHPDDAGLAYMSAEQNACDTMIECGRPRAKASSFAYRKVLINTLAEIADCAEDYGYRRRPVPPALLSGPKPLLESGQQSRTCRRTRRG